MHCTAHGVPTVDRGAGASLEEDPHIQLLVTEIGMPALSGLALADPATPIRPAQKIILISG